MGFHTYPWLEKTFPDYYPWTYFSAHPYIGDKIRRGQPFQAIHHFERVIPVWATAWDDKLGTVHPDSVGEAVKNTSYEKAIIHYLQPHGPWIGSPNRWVIPWTLLQHDQRQLMADWKAIVIKPNPKFFRKCYRDNLRLVLGSVEKYLPYFRKPVVISADHGEMLGEKGLYLHGAVLKSKEHLGYPRWAIDFLRQIPWFTVQE